MKLKLSGLFFQKSTRWHWAKSKMHRIKKTLQEPLAMFCLSFSKRQSAFYWHSEWKFCLWYLYKQSCVFQGGVNFLIWCFWDYAQCHLVDFWKKLPTNFNFIWLEWNTYDSSIYFHIVWSCSSIFKLQSSPAQGWKYTYI